MKTRTIEVKGMSCNHCAQSVTQALSGLPGIGNVRIDLLGGAATFEDSQGVADDVIRQAIERTGFTPGVFK